MSARKNVRMKFANDAISTAPPTAVLNSRQITQKTSQSNFRPLKKGKIKFSIVFRLFLVRFNFIYFVYYPRLFSGAGERYSSSETDIFLSSRVEFVEN